jgi:hypothetical protein
MVDKVAIAITLNLEVVKNISAAAAYYTHRHKLPPRPVPAGRKEA